MFKVIYSAKETLSENVFATADKVEPCLALALELHRISNVPHRIVVASPSDVVVTLVTD